MITPLPALTRPDWLTADLWPWEIRTVNSPTGRVAVTDAGAGPVLLFVHVGMWSFVWRDAIRRLEGSFRCVTLDAPGNGLSDHPESSPISLDGAASAVRAVVTDLDLENVTLVVHDLGGPAGIAGMADTPDRVAGIVAVNTFAWRPSGAVFRGMLRFISSAPVRESSALTGWLHVATSTRFGAGRHWGRAERRAFRAPFDARRRRATHRYLGSALTTDVYPSVESVLSGPIADLPVMTIFGERNDPLRLQPRWKQKFPEAVQRVVPKGNHFPMCDAPADFAAWIHDWYRTHVQD